MIHSSFIPSFLHSQVNGVQTAVQNENPHHLLHRETQFQSMTTDNSSNPNHQSSDFDSTKHVLIKRLTRKETQNDQI